MGPNFKSEWRQNPISSFSITRMQVRIAELPTNKNMELAAKIYAQTDKLIN